MDPPFGDVPPRAGFKSPSDTSPLRMFSPGLNGGLHQSLAWLVGKSQVELGVYICLVGGVGFTDHLREVGERGHDGRMSSRLIWRRPVAVQISAWAVTFLALGLGDPRPITAGLRPRPDSRGSDRAAER
jgi:hypothetical protein